MKKSKSKTTASTKGLKKIGDMPTRHPKKTYKDLKREAVIRGMPFPDVVEADVYRLMGFINNSESKPDISLIDKFDDWVDVQLEQSGYGKDSPLRSSRLRLGFLGDEDEKGNRASKRVKGIPKPKKPKRERDDNGLYKGTKKSYTFELANRGFPLERVIRRIKQKFPDASDKSINIWFRACLKQKGVVFERKKSEKPDGVEKKKKKVQGKRPKDKAK